MSKNNNTTKREKESKISASTNEEKNVKITLEEKKKSIKKKGGYNVLQHPKKKNGKQLIKQKNTSQKTTKKLNVSNMLLKCNKELYDYQIQQLDLILKQSLNCPTLTQDELKMLFVKYKSDGHYRANTTLPQFTNFSDNTCDVINENQYYNQMQYVPTHNTDKVHPKNTTNTIINPYCNTDNEIQPMKENVSVCESTQSNLKCHLPQSIEISETSNMDSLTENKCLSVDCNPLNNSNCNHMFTNHDVQMYQNNINVLNDIQNFNQLKSDLNIVSTENVATEHHNYKYTKKNLLYNIFDSNLQYGNLNNSEISQQNDIYSILQYNDLQLNSDFCNDICLNKWNTDENNNLLYKNAQVPCIPHTNGLKSCYNVNNSMTASQMSLIKNYIENEGNINLPIHTNTYPFTSGKKDLIHEFNENINTQQDFNPYFANSDTISDDLTESNTLALSCPNIVKQLSS
nr:putative uncharacterized protein DDB_G0282133 [Osmia lignaria]